NAPWRSSPRPTASPRCLRCSIPWRPGRFHRRCRPPCKSVVTPSFAAHAVADEEQPIRIIFGFDRRQPGIVAAPERVLPVFLEVIAFRDIRPRARRDFEELVHSQADAEGIEPR